jgi:hypothetical protein
MGFSWIVIKVRLSVIAPCGKLKTVLYEKPVSTVSGTLP